MLMIDLDDRLLKILAPYVAVESITGVKEQLKAALLQALPEPIDMEQKYETTPQRGIHLALRGPKNQNDSQLEYLCHFAEDIGFNIAIESAKATLEGRAYSRQEMFKR